MFTKAPVAGDVKTRLIPAVGAEGAASLHHELVVHTLANLARQSFLPVTLCCSPCTDHSFFAQLERCFNIDRVLQQGDDLGARMAYAVQASLRQGEWPILVGTDCPALDSDMLEAAYLALVNGKEVVLAPAEDGGYALLGVKHYDGRLFDAISWGTGAVLEQTLNALDELRRDTLLLPTVWDVDRPEDIQRYSDYKKSVGVSAYDLARCIDESDET